MNLYKLLSGINYEIKGNGNVSISALSCDTRTVVKDCLFFCLIGQKDGHLFAKKAQYDGAAAVVVERYIEVSIPQILVHNTRSVMALVAKQFYSNACDNLKTIAVIGTNGKTSTTYILDAVFSSAGYSTAVIGTNGIFINGIHKDSKLTTPDPIDLHREMEEMSKAGVEYLFIEVSAHAIYYNKLDGICASAAVFTNFSQDHLDFFENLKQYAEVKKSFFNSNHTKTAIINADDVVGQELIAQCSVPFVSYGYSCPSDIFALDYVEEDDGIAYTVNACAEIAKVKYRLRGMFNLYNTLCATAVARVFGINLDRIVRGINNLKKIDGRNEVYSNNGRRIVVDFAHTPDGVKNILAHLRQITKSKLICVFGCGGNRDRFKRPLMGKIVSSYCDYAILTDDNPRYEPSKEIIADIECGMSIDYEINSDRRNAIERALALAESGDTIAILGKGAEKYQEIKGVKIPFCDSEVLSQLLN